MATYIVTPDSPPRYFILGADSDEELEELSLDETQKLAATVLDSVQQGNKDHRLFLHISFHHPRTHQRHVQVISDISCTAIKDRNFYCEYNIPDSHPCFFSASYQKHWSQIRVYYQGTNSEEQPVLVRNQTTYLSCKEPYHFCSTDLHAYVQLSLLTDPMRKSLGLPTSTSKVRKRLFQDDDEAVSTTVYKEKIETGMLLALKKILIKISLPEPRVECDATC